MNNTNKMSVCYIIRWLYNRVHCITTCPLIHTHLSNQKADTDYLRYTLKVTSCKSGYVMLENYVTTFNLCRDNSSSTRVQLYASSYQGEVSIPATVVIPSHYAGKYHSPPL